VPLCNYAYSLVSDRLLAEDVVQDIFLHLWKNNESLSINSTMKSFLFTSVKNKVYENARSRKSYQKALDSYKQKHGSATVEMSSESDKYMSMERLSSLLRHLPPKCRNVFALNKLNGLTYTEIAESEGISVKTVENHMIKALKILRTEYRKNG